MDEIGHNAFLVGRGMQDLQQGASPWLSTYGSVGMKADGDSTVNNGLPTREADSRKRSLRGHQDLMY